MLDIAVHPKVVLVVGATGALGLKICKAVMERGAQVRVLVRATSDRSRLEGLGVTDFVVGDMMDAASLRTAFSQTPRADAVIARAAGYTRHSKVTHRRPIASGIATSSMHPRPPTSDASC